MLWTKEQGKSPVEELSADRQPIWERVQGDAHKDQRTREGKGSQMMWTDTEVWEAPLHTSCIPGPSKELGTLRATWSVLKEMSILLLIVLENKMGIYNKMLGK